MNLYTAAITLFLVMNPLGNIPIFITTLQHIAPKRRQKIIMREAFFAFLILFIFLLLGKPILEGLQVTPEALGIAGGMILFIISIRMIFPQIKEKSEEPQGEPFLVPLAVPLFAGPATMAMVMLLANQTGKLWFTCSALVLAWVSSTLLLLASSILSKFLGKRGLIALERLMGMILTTIAIQMFLTGINGYFHIVH